MKIISSHLATQTLSFLVAAVSTSAAGLSSGMTETVQLGLTDAITTLRENGTESLGDIFTWDRGNKIYKTNDPSALGDADVLGDNQGHCVRLTNAGDDSEWDCIFTIFFDDGQIMAHGPFNAGSTTCVITGGSGAYDQAEGTMELSFAGTHNADGMADATGIYFSYNYNFDIELNGDDEEGKEKDSSDGRRLGQCSSPSVVAAIQLGLAGTMPWW